MPDVILWGSPDACRRTVHTVMPREISVLDRIGGGDGFVGGLLYALIRGLGSAALS